MRLSVHHETRFDYDTAPSYLVQRLTLTPPEFASQKVLAWKISAPGMDTALSYVDGFGNRVHLVTSRSHSGPLTITAEGLVEVSDVAGVVRGLPSLCPDSVFLRQTAATLSDPAMCELAEGCRRGAALDTLHALMAAIHGHVAYEIGATHAHTTAAEAFQEQRGVCQDHAHIFIGLARHLGIPSRYVTGYLVTADGAASTAAHAWAEALVPDLGWVGFDAANALCPNDHYVRVAAGIDASGVTPIKGSRRGGGHAERMNVAVRVEIAQQ